MIIFLVKRPQRNSTGRSVWRRNFWFSRK